MSAADEYTPATEDVRDDYVAFAEEYGSVPVEEGLAQFERWLAQHDAEVKAEALRDYANARYKPYLDNPTIPWPQQPSQLARQYAKAIEELHAEADRILTTPSKES